MITFNDQEAFLQIIRPPAGYSLHYCFGATFSLDLECVVALAQVAIKHEDPNGADAQDEHRILQGITDFSEKSLILFQSCQIKALDKNKVALKGQGYRDLIALLDPMISPVSSPRLKCSFHPKVWFMRFDKSEGKGDEKFRLLVMSRNLSKQMDWEIGCALDGCRDKTADDISRDLRKFLLVNEHAVPEPKKRLYREMLNDLRFIAFSKPPSIKSVNFLFKHPKRREGPWINEKDYEALIIISPFLNTNMVYEFLKGISNKNRLYIVTSLAHAYMIKEISELHKHTYIFNPGQVNVEYGDGCKDIEMGLHAKMYIGLRKDGNGTDMFLGSANCTFNGLKGPNTEAMMLLRSSGSAFKEFLGNFVFQKIKNEIPQNWLKSYLELNENELNSAEKKAKVEKKLSDARSVLAMGKFNLHVKNGSKQAILFFVNPKMIHLPKGVHARVSLWECSSWHSLTACAKSTGALFRNKNGFQSDFVRVRLSCEGEAMEFMSVAQSNIKKTSRNRAIMSRYLQNPKDFFRYLMLILKMPGHTSTTGGGGRRQRRKRKKERSLASEADKFLEEILIKASHNELVIRQINEALKAIRHENKEFKGFAEFWREFCKADEEIKRNG